MADAEAFGRTIETLCGGKTDLRVAVLMATSIEYISVWHAALLGWFTIVPVNVRLSPGEIAAILADARPRLLLHDDAFATLAQQVATDACPARAFSSLKLESSEGGVDLPSPKSGEVAAMVYTNGTTGAARGVCQTQAGLAHSALALNCLWDLMSRPAHLYQATPLFHVSGFNGLIAAPAAGAEVFVQPRFSAENMLQDIRSQQLTHVALVPSMLEALIGGAAMDDAGFTSLRYVSYGGSPVSPDTLDRLRRALPHVRIVQAYGMTESGGALTVLTDADHLLGGSLLRSAGRPLPGVRLRIGRDVGEGEGEIEFSAPWMAAGYWGDHMDESSRWFRTGDIGRLDDAGYVYLLDRAKDMIITGGENVYSVEVERVLEQHPAIVQAAVLGVPSAVWGEQVHAILVVREPVADAALLAFCRERLAAYKCPKSIEFREQLPLSATGKVLKRALRAPYWEGVARAIA